MAKRSFSQMDAGGEWDEFFERMGSRLIGSLVLVSGDRTLAEECAQEAFARAFERWDRVRTFESPDAWVYRTAVNLARSSIRRAAMERRNQHRLITPAPLPDSATAIAVRDAVGHLPPRQRAVIVARFYLGLDVAQTARFGIELTEQNAELGRNECPGASSCFRDSGLGLRELVVGKIADGPRI